MKNSILIAIIIAILIILGVIGFALMQNPVTDKQPANNPIETNVAQSSSIVISNFAFSPSTITIRKGESVTWINQDSASHTVTSDSGNELDSASLAKGESYSHTFNTIGEYNYHCTFHPSMKAKVIVK